MPLGKAHEKLWRHPVIRNTAILISVIIGVGFKNPLLGIGFYFGYVLHRWLDPDLDLLGRSLSERRMIWDFGLLGYVFRSYWTIYAKVCKLVGGGHRGWLSHSPLLSSAFRLAFGFWWLYFFWVPPMELVIVVWLGLSYSDLVHILADFGVLGGG